MVWFYWIPNNRSSFFFHGNLNTENYINILRQEIEPFVDNMPVRQFQRLYYQHDGAPGHTSNETRNYLNAQFGEDWIGNITAELK